MIAPTNNNDCSHFFRQNIQYEYFEENNKCKWTRYVLIQDAQTFLRGLGKEKLCIFNLFSKISQEKIEILNNRIGPLVDNNDQI